MNKQIKIILIFLITTALLSSAAYKFDQQRAQQKQSAQLEKFDRDISALEESYLQEIGLLNEISPATLRKIEEYQQAQDYSLKHKIFQEIVMLSAKDSGNADSNNPLIRKQLDKLAGLSNRHDIMMKERSSFSKAD